MSIKGSAFYQNGGPILMTVDLTKPLDVAVEYICNELNLDKTKHAYKIIENKNTTNIGYYLTEENKYTLVNGFNLQLVPSIEHLVNKIFANIRIDNHPFFNLPTEALERKQTFDELYHLATDPTFIKHIVSKNLHHRIVVILKERKLTGSEASACLLTFLHLLKIQAVTDIAYDPFMYILEFATIEQIVPCQPLAYSVLIQILHQKNPNFKNPKETIISKLEISKLIKKLNLPHENKDLDSCTVQLINAMVRAVQGDARISLIKEMKVKVNREVINQQILCKTNITKNVAHELWTYQAYILSLHKEALYTYLDPTNNEEVRDIFQLEEFTPRCSTIYDFESSAMIKRSTSQDTILSSDDNRISLASLKSVHTLKSIGSMYSDDYLEDYTISYLALENLRHYKANYYKHFCQSQNDEKDCEPGILYNAEKITKLLAKILRIGKEIDKHCQNYHPIIFNTEYKHDFFCELFCRAMWLLLKTRREMKAVTYDDHDKVLKILKKQIEMVLSEKPKTYKEFDDIIRKINYSVVSLELDKEYDKDLKKLLDTNPCVKELKENFTKSNEKIIFQQKIKLLQNGHPFPKLPIEKKREQYMKVRLSNNRKIVYYGDWDNILKKYTSPEESFNVEDIVQFIFGRNCPHVKDGSVKKHEQAFTMKLGNDKIINFYAVDEKTANNWIDGFSMLLRKPHRSEQYKKDMQTLVEMDCMLQLMELQNIKIPMVPPTVPKPPEIVKPVIPPRSPKLLARLAKYKQKSDTKLELMTAEELGQV